MLACDIAVPGTETPAELSMDIVAASGDGNLRSRNRKNPCQEI